MIEMEEDVLVIGSGGAGLRAAIAAHEVGAKTLVISKTLAGKAGCTVMAEGGYNAAIGTTEPGDSIQAHFEDTMKSGAGLSNPELVHILANMAPERLYDMERYGALFSRGRGGLIAQRKFGAQSFQRTCYAADRTGHEIVMTLLQEMRRQRIDVWNYLLAVDLIVSDHRLQGVLAYDIKHPGFVLIKSKATILATGGACRCWSVTSNSYQGTGDGYGMAARAGAIMCDLEEVQFHPTMMVYPDSAKGILVTEAVRGEGGYLYNVTPKLRTALEENARLRKIGEQPKRIDPKDFGAERFMRRYDPERMELSARDIVTRSITQELSEGRGTKTGGVLLSVVHLESDSVRERLSTMYKQFRDFCNVDITHEPMEVAPGAHHVMGGLVIDKDCRTSLESLYACGEAAGGIHGGNRIGGNALGEGQVFGALAGRTAAVEARNRRYDKINLVSIAKKIQDELNLESKRSDGKLRPYQIKERLQQVMTAKVGVIRDEGGLKEAFDEIYRLEEELKQVGMKNAHLSFNQDVVDYFEVRNMLEFSKLVTGSALLRKESRGAHYRRDFPDRDDENFKKNIFVEGEKIWAEKRWN